MEKYECENCFKEMSKTEEVFEVGPNDMMVCKDCFESLLDKGDEDFDDMQQDGAVFV